VLFFVCILLAVILRSNTSAFGFELYGGISFNTCEESCQADQAVFRVSLALTLFFAAHVLMVGVTPAAIGRNIHASFFGFKFLAFIPLLVGMFYVDPDRIDEYADAARIFSLFFLVIQSIAIIDTAYKLHNWMISGDQNSMYALNLGLSIILFMGAYVAIGFLFEWFTTGGDCHVEKFMLSTVVIVPVFFTVLSGTEVVSHGAIFVSACINAYVVYIAHGALSSNPSEQCNNTIDRARNTEGWQIALGIAFTAVSVTYFAYTLSDPSLFGNQDEEEGELGKEGKKSNEAREVGDDNDGEQVEVSPEEAEQDKKQTIIFHVLMTVASMYIGMLLTRWSSQDYTNRDSAHLSEESFWVQTTSMWLIMILYTWTLLAPMCFPDRDFS